jgi:hypothetical protein
MNDRSSTKPASGDRETFIWRSSETAEDNARRLVNVIAAKAVAEIFSADGHLHRLHGGRLVSVIKDDMREIVN